MHLWLDRLGDPGQGNGHGLTIKEHGWWPNEWPYCYKKQEKPEDALVWNPIVPAQTVVINELAKKIPGAGAVATTGYIPEDWPTMTPRNGRHKVMINPGAKELTPNSDVWLGALAHEFGMGSSHTSQN